ncbi:MAG: hypothetical protein MUD12_16740 [Spirochaetes bacterium]|nr:hypothetical protein [Spirochaetota bacterium]
MGTNGDCVTQPEVINTLLYEMFLRNDDFIKQLIKIFVNSSSIRDNEDALDIQQEVYHRAIISKSKLKDSTKEKEFISQSVYNTCRIYYSKKMRALKGPSGKKHYKKEIEDLKDGSISKGKRITPEQEKMLRDLGCGLIDADPPEAGLSRGTIKEQLIRRQGREDTEEENEDLYLVIAILSVILITYNKENLTAELIEVVADQREEVAVHLREWINKIKKPLKKTIGLLYFCDFNSQKQIANRLNKSQSNVSEHIGNIRRHLLEMLVNKFPGVEVEKMIRNVELFKKKSKEQESNHDNESI